jgi:hypothetical protein
MMNAFLLLRNNTYEHSLTSVIQDTRTLVMDVWQELEWTDPRLTWDDELHNLRLPMTEIWTKLNMKNESNRVLFGTMKIETTRVALENGR